MARGGRADLTVDFSDFEKSLELLLTKVGRATRKATEAAIQDIAEEADRQVPMETGALGFSQYTEIHGNYKEGFYGVVGYGGPNDQLNDKQGRMASDYMIVVHEDLSAHHEVGKAKFLEDPIKEYQSKMGARASQFIRSETGM